MTLRLKAAAFTPIPTSSDDSHLSLQEQARALAGLMHQHHQQLTSEQSEGEPLTGARHFLCSTMLELPFTSGALSLTHFRHADDPLAPSSYINTYECASWGYTLRYYLSQLKQAGQSQGQLLFSILDANLMGLSFWRQNENWGHSGFGLTSVWLDVEDVDSALQHLATSCAQTWNATPEFATLIRRHTSQRDDITLGLPFFPDHIRQIFDKLLAEQTRLPDHHARWGHVFGSDPWLAIIEQQQTAPTEQRYLPASIALNGYYCWAEVSVGADSRCYLNDAFQWPQERVAC
ncbi:hypothetical protein CHH28_02865 [Bacterioplanes sanyensis]|uniref:Uncharacterized protein n=1 Tax=Bacterioplanes sanyensis TaxID=1249553 RepID=A0A222FGR1_9GAMM|nr:hypothetical protein [Bacterioplanes sanyensis]ASP37674.1 hypothetical protein CHH28_02865 [Bacterioplanes sanyensis]